MRSEFEENEMGFEQEMQAAMTRVAAPHKLKERILAARCASVHNLRSIEQKPRIKTAQRQLIARIAATVLLTVAVCGALIAHHIDEERKAEIARKQLYLALQITQHAFEHVQDRLAEKSQPHE